MWHRAAERGDLVALEIIWIWAKKAKLNPDELLLAKNKSGETALHFGSPEKPCRNITETVGLGLISANESK
jgi:hypothetical protein